MEILCPKTNQVVQEFKAGPSGVVSRLKSDFEEVKSLGAGGYGCVVEVRNKIDGQHYALKKVKLTTDSGLGYDDVVRSLNGIMKDLAEEKTKSVFKQIIEGVSHIHSEGIAHGDLTPSNIFLNETKEVVKIGDFGLAQMSKEKHIRPTTIYRAPELGDPCTFTTSSDIYSVGIIVLKMFARFGNDHEKARELEQFKEKETWPESLNTASSFTKNLIRIMTKRSPEHRPTANTVLTALRSI